MRRRYAANPPGLCIILVGGTAQKVNIQRFGFVYIAGEEQTDIVVLKSTGARDAFQRHLNNAVIEQLIPQPTFELPVRRGFLVEFYCVLIYPPCLHRSISRLEQDVPRLDSTIMNMLEIKAGVKRNEQIPVLRSVSE